MSTNDYGTGGLSAWHHDLAKLLAAGMTYTAAGEQLGASKATVARAMRDGRLRRLVDTQRQSNVDALLGKNIPEAERSIEFLAMVRDNPRATMATRVKASCELLQSAARLGRYTDSSPITVTEAREFLNRELFAIRGGRDAPDDGEAL